MTASAPAASLQAKKEKVIVILGPTAVGKTDLSLDLAELLHSEIISGDSMLVYRGFDIGSAKPTPAERRGIPHHLIDILDADEPYTVTRFQEQAAAWIHALNEKGQIPILAGGTGLYIKALLEGYAFSHAEGHEDFRAEMERLAQEKGKEAVHALLEQADPETAARLHVNDFRRVVRALETLKYGGTIVSQEKRAADTAESLVYDACVIGLRRERQALYARINRRVDLMMEAGLEDEVRGLLAKGVEREAPAMKGIGYKEIAAYLAGEGSRKEAVATVKLHTRHFAKRQLTWYRKMPYIEWVDVDGLSPEEVRNQALARLKKRGFFPIGVERMG